MNLRLSCLLLALAPLLVGSGCQHGSPHFYPIGVYGVRSTNDLALLKQTGFNVVAGPARADFLQAARAQGLRVLASPGTSAGSSFNAAAARATVGQFDRDSALWAWYLIDEPDLNRVSPDEVRKAQAFIKSLRPHKPTALVLYQGSSALHYANIADITMIDRYPIPWLPLANFGQHVRMTRLALGPKKPLIAVVQAFNWRYYPELLQTDRELREPTYEEIRAMAYSALAQRADGLFFYAYDDGKWRIRDHPSTWEAVRKVVGEIHARLPLFAAEHVWWPYQHEYAELASRFNEALESSISPALLHVPEGNSAIPPGDYILTVNTTGKSHHYGVSLPQPVSPAETVPVLGENRAVAVEEGWIEDQFEPYQVHVYGPLPPGKK